jgi:hypothetical protein
LGVPTLPDPEESVNIGMPVKCVYRGGHAALGSHGRHFRIEGDKLGHGEFSLTHAIPLATVTSIEVTEHQFGGSPARTVVGLGIAGGIRGGSATPPRQVTVITVRTRDGQEPTWEVEHRGGAWVRERLTPVLRRVRIPYYEDLPPSERKG